MIATIEFTQIFGPKIFVIGGWIVFPKGKTIQYVLKSGHTSFDFSSKVVTFYRPDLLNVRIETIADVNRFGFFAVFDSNATLEYCNQIVEINSEDETNAYEITTSPPNAEFQYFKTCQQNMRMRAIREISRYTNADLNEEAIDSFDKSIRAWLDEIDLLTNSLIPHVPAGIDSAIYDDQGHVFVEGWQSARPGYEDFIIEAALVGFTDLRFILSDCAFRRPDLESLATYSGDRKAPGFLILAKGSFSRLDHPPPVVILRVARPTQVNYLKIALRKVDPREFYCTSWPRLLDERKITPAAAKAARDFISDCRSPKSPPQTREKSAASHHRQKISTVIIHDFSLDDPHSRILRSNLFAGTDFDGRILVVPPDTAYLDNKALLFPAIAGVKQAERFSSLYKAAESLSGEGFCLVLSPAVFSRNSILGQVEAAFSAQSKVSSVGAIFLPTPKNGIPITHKLPSAPETITNLAPLIISERVLKSEVQNGWTLPTISSVIWDLTNNLAKQGLLTTIYLENFQLYKRDSDITGYEQVCRAQDMGYFS